MRTNLNAQSRGSDSKFDVFLCSCHAHGGWRRLCSRNHSPHMESERQQPASIPHAVSKNSQFKICQSPAMVQLIKQLSHDLILTLSNYKELSTFRIWFRFGFSDYGCWYHKDKYRTDSTGLHCRYYPQVPTYSTIRHHVPQSNLDEMLLCTANPKMKTRMQTENEKRLCRQWPLLAVWTNELSCCPRTVAYLIWSCTLYEMSKPPFL